MKKILLALALLSSPLYAQTKAILTDPSGAIVQPSGRVTTTAPVTGHAGFNLPEGTDPTSPVDGDLWTTSAGIFVRIGGTTLGPLASGSGFLPTTGGTMTGAVNFAGADALFDNLSNARFTGNGSVYFDGTTATQASGLFFTNSSATFDSSSGIVLQAFNAGAAGILMASSSGGNVIVATSGTDYAGMASAGVLAAASGVNLTDLNATQLTSGTVPAAQLPTATTSTLGAVKVDGTTITIASGVISAVGGGSGTVTSVAMTVPTGLAISGSPITSSGTLGLTWSGTIPAAQLPNPSASTLGGIESLASVSHKWINTISTSGVPSATQPAFTDISGSVADGQLSANVPLLNASNTFTGTLNSFTGTETTVAAPINASDACTKAYADAIAGGLSVRSSVVAATTTVLAGTPTYANGSSGVGATLTEVGFGALVVDGITLAIGDRLLVKNQVTSANNGIYTVTVTGGGAASYVITRATDYNTTNLIFAGTFCLVESGTVNQGASYVMTTSGTITVGTTAIAWTELVSPGASVTSVTFTGDGVFLSSTPSTAVTTTGTLTAALLTQTANKVLAGPTTGSAANPTFRSLVSADVPTLNQNTTGSAASLSATLAIASGGTGQTSASSAFNALSPLTTSGDVLYGGASGAGTRLAANSTGTNKYLKSVSSGVPDWAQVAFSDLSGSATAAQLPNPTASTLGGIESLAAVTSKWINTISTSGVPSATQPAFTDISGSVAAGQMPALTGDVTTSAGAVATTIAANAVTNAKMATMAANTVKANNTGSSATPTDVALSTLVDTMGSTTQGAVLYRNGTVWTALAPGTNGQFLTSGGASANVSWTTSGGGGGSSTLVAPQGRLTLVTATPVQTTDQTAKTNVYYTPFKGAYVPIYSGSAWTVTAFTELTLALDPTSGHTGYQQSGKVFDLFVVSDSGTIRLGTGPAWTSSTARGTGAGTTELERVNGLWVNKNSMTLRFGSASGNTITSAVDTATYVGTMYATADGQTGIALVPAAAAGGTNNIIGIWNCYNRVPMASNSMDNTSSWTYGTASWRSMDASTSNRVSWVDGQAESTILAHGSLVDSNGFQYSIGVGLDSTTALYGAGASCGSGGPMTLCTSVVPQLGFHYAQFLENSTNGASSGGLGVYLSIQCQHFTISGEF